MDPFTNKGTVQDAHSKKSYTKQATSEDQVPRFDITGQPFRSHPAAVPFIIQQSCVFNVCWTTEDLFRITMQCFKSLDTMELVFQQCMSSINKQCSTVHGQQDTFSEQKMHPSHNKQWFKTVHGIL
ncbi:hypothetical protein TNCT_670531 [Trichonephila clavata]|uniref:Uncharacterized protein n=1 Tax=Trichonephila clavata TaxID=2740835 RepID=A0A8X6L2W9_TRICU|nr:hypothetical protein TNCT_670531 [Trichonephila clavata]